VPSAVVAECERQQQRHGRSRSLSEHAGTVARGEALESEEELATLLRSGPHAAVPAPELTLREPRDDDRLRVRARPDRR